MGITNIQHNQGILLQLYSINMEQAGADLGQAQVKLDDIVVVVVEVEVVDQSLAKVEV